MGKRRMESRDKVVALFCPSMHSNNSKLSNITTGKVSVKSQLITYKPNKFKASEWHQSSPRGFTGQEKAATKSKPTILQGNTQCRIKVYWTSSPFLINYKFDFTRGCHVGTHCREICDCGQSVDKLKFCFDL